ncbi:hypothetical protein PHSY_001377 [Pseudozyma hubeiensis SY62]|uniref:Uncharacterized protein n=1 Tax=Pseudozyma hubeiensis (strain SY62) TaxID=1305764 RepID=R9NYS7_PSEHS|nr:hypothetical protein PHSY_001377 [Pseudozyma hubeiensis SY62]GAC93812.1 hypothetical protein PHSY_001377 [Pseudozyma hubeiensis SY62]
MQVVEAGDQCFDIFGSDSLTLDPERARVSRQRCTTAQQYSSTAAVSYQQQQLKLRIAPHDLSLNCESGPAARQSKSGMTGLGSAAPCLDRTTYRRRHHHHHHQPQHHRSQHRQCHPHAAHDSDLPTQASPHTCPLTGAHDFGRLAYKRTIVESRSHSYKDTTSCTSSSRVSIA